MSNQWVHTKEYWEGQIAFIGGHERYENPFANKKGSWQYQAWDAGWKDEDTEEFLRMKKEQSNA
jgi:hypothetical protein